MKFHLLTLLALAATLSIAVIESPDIQISLVNQNPDPVEPGESAELSFKVYNNGSRTGDQITVELISEYPFIILDEPTKTPGSLYAFIGDENSLVVKYNVMVDKNANAGSHEIGLRYKVGEGGWNEATGLKVTVKALEVAIEVLSAESENPLKAGGEEKFHIDLANVGKSILKNLRVKMDLEGLPFTPIGSSNEKVIGRILPGQNRSLEFNLAAESNAMSGIYKVPLVLNFVDDSGEEQSRTSSVGIVIYDAPEFNLAIRDSEVYQPNSLGDVVVSISNTGPSEIKFITIELMDTGDYDIASSPSIYIGTLEVDDFQTAQFRIRTGDVEPGDLGLKLKLKYKDSLNREIVEEKHVSLPLYSSDQASKLGLSSSGLSSSSNGKGGFLATYFTFGVVVILGSFALFMLVNCIKSPMARYKKILWIAIILTGIGTVIYYFVAREKNELAR